MGRAEGLPRIFISHSAKEGAAREFLDSLVDVLRADAYPVVVDHDNLELGTGWRSTLNVWIGSCDVAVVLLSEGALTSAYVAYEASILTYRAGFDPRFRLLPVFLDGVDYHAVQSSPLGPSQIHEVQGALADLTPEAAIARLIGIVGTATPAAETPLENAVSLVVDRLKDVPPHYLESCVEGLDAQLAPWMPGSELRRTAALTMMAVGLERSAPYIVPFRSLIELDDLCDLVDLIACSWVDYRSINNLPEAATAFKPVAVNADSPLVAKMYVIRAASEKKKPPRDAWALVAVDGVPSAPDGSESAALPSQVETLKRQIFERLSDEFVVTDEEELNEQLEISTEAGEPVFVALPALGSTAAVLNELRRVFRTVTFFVLAGPSVAPGDLEDAGIVFLRPELEDGAETDFCRRYDRKRTLLTQRLNRRGLPT